MDSFDRARGAAPRRWMLPGAEPMRTLAITSFINSAGSSLLVTSLVLYFTQVVGLSGARVALGLTLGGGLGLLVGVPLGHLGDRRGARELMIALFVLQALATLAYVFVESFAAFLVSACVVGAFERGASAVRSGVVVRSLPDDGQRVRDRAHLRAVTNVGFAAGSAVAVLGIAADSATTYRAMFAADAVSFLAVAALSLRLARLPVLPAVAGAQGLAVLRDRPYLAVVGLTALLGLHNSMLDVGLPLWVSGHTEAPNAIVGVIFVLNCVAVALFSVRLAASSEAPVSAARTARRAGWTLLVACVLVAVSGSVGAIVAVAVLVAGMLLQAIGEMQQAASQWGLTLGLARDDLQGQYQGAAQTGVSLALSIGPVTMAAVVALGSAGWLLFGAALLAVGVATVPTARWALSVRARGLGSGPADPDLARPTP